MMWKLENGLYIEKQLEKYGVINFTTTVLYGDMKNEKNRQKFLEKYLGIKHVVFGNQTHSSNIKIVNEKSINKQFYSADGFITDKQKIPLAVFTADCLPVFIYDTVKKIIGLIHAGRIGLQKLIIQKAITVFVEKFSSKPASIFVAVGPHIQKCCYEVDLNKIVRKQLQNKGIKKISFANICTHNKKFFSYRKNKTGKRMMSLMMMK